MSKSSALSTLGKVTSATRSKAEEIWEYAHSKGFDLTRLWGMGGGDEHGVGRAIDFMILGKGLGKTVGLLIANYLWKHRKRFGLKWLIWDGEIWSTTPDKNGKERGRSAYHGKSDHSDHVHAFFGTGAYVPPASGGGGGSKPATKTVDLSKLIAAAKADPKRKQGGTTPGAAASVKIVEDALRRRGLLSSKYSSDGSFGSLTVKAYSRWQQQLGYEGTKPGDPADGIPGRKSLEQLGKQYGFKVVS